MPKQPGWARRGKGWQDGSYADGPYSNEQPASATGPGCPGCWDPAPEGCYPKSVKGPDWWCQPCLNEKIREEVKHEGSN